MGSFLIASLVLVSTAMAAKAPDRAAAGRISKVLGPTVVNIVNTAHQAARTAKAGDAVYEGDKTATLEGQTVVVQFNDKTELAISPRSSLEVSRFEDVRQAQKTLFTLFYGKARVSVRRTYLNDDTFLLRAPGCFLGVRGTEFVVETDASTRQTRLHSLEGTVLVAREQHYLERFMKLNEYAARVIAVERGYGVVIPQDTKTLPEPARFERNAFETDAVSEPARRPDPSKQAKLRRANQRNKERFKQLQSSGLIKTDSDLHKAP